jgi:hypothetical protein
MPILTTEQAIAHCRADPDADAPLVELYLDAAIDAAQDYLGRKLYEDAQAMVDAGDETGLVPNFAVKAAILLICAHLFENRENVLTGVTAQTLPMGAHDLLRPHRRSFGL